MTFYKKFIKPGRWGYPLRGGRNSRWRLPLARVLYRKRLDVGPEPERPRSVWLNWNYDAEIYALSKRLNENFNEKILKQAFIHPSYNKIQEKELQEAELSQNQPISFINNAKLVEDGEAVCRLYLRSILKFWYPRLPTEAVEKVSSHVLDTAKLSQIAKNLGLVDLIKSEDFPAVDETKKLTLYAIIGALKQSSGLLNAQLFVNDFIVTQLIGKNLNELWNVANPMVILLNELKKDGVDEKKVETRLLWSTGVHQPNAAYIVGLYIDKEQFSIGNGETMDTAEEMAARDGLRRIYGTTDDKAPLPYGDKARKFSQIINSLYETNLNQK